MRRIFKTGGDIPGCAPAADKSLLLFVFHFAVVLSASDIRALRIPFLFSFS
jgi:hypothetical protein